ncbi:hypothetical protein C1645_836154 [Glomus cerebriforme]|uniref:DNA-directed DNA polymerase n=1 Tax=Glomus cerebriforme TaxID=658196 RepID=A0A397S7J7_9GLOM|nr:hypothetical protein C1645_836154 [Glomus cerebriforme]
MRDRHTREEADVKRRIKKGLTPEPYLYEIPEPGERFEYIVIENDPSQKVGDKMEYPEALKKVKDANKVSDDKVDNGGMDEDDLDEDEEDEDEIDKDKVSKIRDALAQKSAEKWIRGTYADKIVKYSGNDVYWSSYLNALDKQEESIRLKLTTLLAEISKIDVGCRDRMYKLVTKPGKCKSKAMTLERYILAYIQENECELLANLWGTWYKVGDVGISAKKLSGPRGIRFT